MFEKKRKPNHPGIILDELYIKPLNMNLQELAETLCVSRNTLFKIRTAKAAITPDIALGLADVFNTTPNLWLNLQQNFDLWVAQDKKEKRISPTFKSSKITRSRSRKATT